MTEITWDMLLPFTVFFLQGFETLEINFDTLAELLLSQ